MKQYSQHIIKSYLEFRSPISLCVLCDDEFNSIKEIYYESIS